MKHANQQPQLPQSDAVSAVASLAGPEILDRLQQEFHSIDPVAVSMFSGAMHSADNDQNGRTFDSVGEYRPGIDLPTQLNIHATFAAKRPMANYLRSEANIPHLNVVADLPDRLHNTLGRVTLYNLGRYSVALSLLMAEKARSRATVILADEHGESEVFDDSASDSYIAMTAIDRAEAQELASSGRSPLAEALTHITRETIPERDITVVVSDFMSGHTPDNEPDWQEPLDHLRAGLNDRLLIVRLTSPAQTELPVGLTDLPLDRLQAVREAYREVAAAKAARISNALKYTRHITVDAASTEVAPTLQIVDFLLGKQID